MLKILIFMVRILGKLLISLNLVFTNKTILKVIHDEYDINYEQIYATETWKSTEVFRTTLVSPISYLLSHYGYWAVLSPTTHTCINTVSRPTEY